QPDLGVDRHLANPLDLVLDRILDGEDVHVAGVDPRQRAVKRGGLAAAGGAGDQNNPVRAANDRVDVLEDVLAHPNLRQVQQGGGLVQQAHHDPLAVRGGNGGKADVDVAAGELDSDSPILGQALLGDVQLAHHLDAADDRVLVALRRLDDLLKDAVHTEADDQLALHRLDVDVGGSLFSRAEQQRVEQADAWWLVVGVGQVLRVLQL